MLTVAQGRTIERSWHMFVPPIMTYLDDYQAAYKLKGVDLVLHLLKNTPAHLLHRTGMDVLLATVSMSFHRRCNTDFTAVSQNVPYVSAQPRDA